MTTLPRWRRASTRCRAARMRWPPHARRSIASPRSTAAPAPCRPASRRGALRESSAATEGLAERLSAVDERAAALSGELAEGRTRLDDVASQVERVDGAAVERAEVLRAELSAVRDVAETAHSGLQELRAEL